VYLTQEGSASRLDGLDLGKIDGDSSEACGQLGNVKGGALGGRDGAQLRTRATANACLADANCLLKRTVLLGVVTIGAEGGVTRGAGTASSEVLGQLAGRRGRVRLRRVVNGRRNRARANEPDQGRPLGVGGRLSKSSSSVHGDRVESE
jgi:hypothetical protein